MVELEINSASILILRSAPQERVSKDEARTVAAVSLPR
jgi:hypothetical protein